MASCIQGITGIGPNGWVQGAGATTFFPFSNCCGDENFTTESAQAVTYRFGATMSNLFVRVRTNGFTLANTTVRSRLNGADGNLTVTISAGATGVFTDLTNSDTIASGDTYNASVTTDALGINTIIISVVSATINSTGGGHAVLMGTNSANANFSTASSTRYIQLGGTTVPETTESNAQFRFGTTSTLRNLIIIVTANTTSTTTTIRSRVGAADGNMVISVTSGSTGTFEDTTNTDSVNTASDVNLSVVRGTGSGNFIVSYFGLTASAPITENSDIFSGNSGGANQRGASSAYSFYGFCGEFRGAQEPAFSNRLYFDTTLSNLRILVTVNTYAADATFSLFKNGSAVNNTCTITAGATGLFQDTTHTDDFVSGNDIGLGIIGGTSGSITTLWAAVTSSNETGFKTRVIFM